MGCYPHLSPFSLFFKSPPKCIVGKYTTFLNDSTLLQFWRVKAQLSNGWTHKWCSTKIFKNKMATFMTWKGSKKGSWYSNFPFDEFYDQASLFHGKSWHAAFKLLSPAFLFSVENRGWVSIVIHNVWKSSKMSHSTLRAKRATFVFWEDKSSLKVDFGIFQQFLIY